MARVPLVDSLEGIQGCPVQDRALGDRVVERWFPLAITVAGAHPSIADQGWVEFADDTVLDDWGDFPFVINDDEMVKCQIIRDYHKFKAGPHFPDVEAHNHSRRGHPASSLDNPQFLRLDASLHDWLAHLVDSAVRPEGNTIDEQHDQSVLKLEVWPGGYTSAYADQGGTGWCKVVQVPRVAGRTFISARSLCYLAAKSPWIACV